MDSKHLGSLEVTPRSMEEVMRQELWVCVLNSTIKLVLYSVFDIGFTKIWVLLQVELVDMGICTRQGMGLGLLLWVLLCSTMEVHAGNAIGSSVIMHQIQNGALREHLWLLQQPTFVLLIMIFLATTEAGATRLFSISTWLSQLGRRLESTRVASSPCCSKGTKKKSHTLVS